jgi:amino acid permease
VFGVYVLFCVGTLALPYVLKLTGCVIGLLLIVLGALAALWSLYILVESSRIIRKKDFRRINMAAGRFVPVLFDASMIFVQFSVITMYQIFCKFINIGELS